MSRPVCVQRTGRRTGTAYTYKNFFLRVGTAVQPCPLIFNSPWPTHAPANTRTILSSQWLFTIQDVSPGLPEITKSRSGQVVFYGGFKCVFHLLFHLLAPRIKRARSFRNISYGVTHLISRPMQALGILIFLVDVEAISWVTIVSFVRNRKGHQVIISHLEESVHRSGIIVLCCRPCTDFSKG